MGSANRVFKLFSRRNRNISRTNRKGWLKDTCELIEYALNNNFCTAWDKNLWADIYCYRFVRDVGDWYSSESLPGKLATVYALLHSLYEADIYQYLELQSLLLGEMNTEKHLLIYYSAKVVESLCPDEWKKAEIDLVAVTPELFGKFLSLMIQAKACCHLENEEKWSWTREKQLSKKAEYETKMKGIIDRMKGGDNK